MTTMTQDQTSAPSRIETADEAETLCARLNQTVGDLIALLDRETALLRSGKPHEIAGLFVRKSALSAALSRDLEVFRASSDFIQMAAPDLIETIRARHEMFQKSLQANQDALGAMKSVAESLLRTVAAKAGERRSGPGVYGKDAHLGAAAPARPTAISVDKSL